VDEPTKEAMVVDPAHPAEYVSVSLRLPSPRGFLTMPAFRVIPVLRSQIHDGKINLKAIINTHQ
jgi:hydroxyacylglutathione hydrolase